ncbi:MAG TPA: antibiotic biosynthesis monooxygenase [Rhodanobacteraceae bacterium]|nr:antibiotic biosynthesis monooxygenase [Rhodanobacteraceae bacterium]
MSGGGSFAKLPQPPYYAVIFSSRRRLRENDGYDGTSERLVALVRDQPGFLGVESARGDDGLGITVAYFESEDAIAAWKRNTEHAPARERGRAEWYEGYEIRVARVERAYGWRREES